jgi:hypothetical protein
MSRPRKPQAVLELTGAYKKNPQRRVKDVPAPERELGRPPKYFTRKEVSTWNELKAATAPGVLKCSDAVILEIATRLLTEYRTNADFGIIRIQTLIGCLARMGLSPADRGKINVPAAPKKDPWDYSNKDLKIHGVKP